MSSSSDNINDNNIINEVKFLNRVAKGVKGADFGKIKEVTTHYILSQKVENKDKFYLPRTFLKNFNENELKFAITKQEAITKYKRDVPPSIEEYEIFYKKNSDKYLKNNKKKQNNIKNTDPIKSVPKYKNDIVKNEMDVTQQKQWNNSFNPKKKLRKNVVVEENSNKSAVKISNIKDKNEKGIDGKVQALQKIKPIRKSKAETNTRIIILQSEEKAKQESKRVQKIKKEDEKDKQNSATNIVIKNNKESNGNLIELNNPEEVFDPFFMSIEIWQNYSIYWIDKIKEIFQSATELPRYLETTKEHAWTNNSIYRWFGTYST